MDDLVGVLDMEIQVVGGVRGVWNGLFDSSEGDELRSVRLEKFRNDRGGVGGRCSS